MDLVKVECRLIFATVVAPYSESIIESNVFVAVSISVSFFSPGVNTFLKCVQLPSPIRYVWSDFISDSTHRP